MRPTYQIGEVSRRSGFKPSTLRYYEDIGLVPAAARTAAGYRTYDDAAVDRLAFIARAKQLGCTLEEMTDLVAVWDQQRCEPVQARLRDLVAAKLVDAHRQAASLAAFTGQLERVLEVLVDHSPEAPDGPCNQRCGCTAGPEASTSTSTEAPVAPVVACTLAPAQVPDRVQAWREVVAFVTSRTPLDDGVRLGLGADAPIGAVVSLAVAEQGCCSFFRFAITVDERGTALEVRAPAEALGSVEALFAP